MIDRDDLVVGAVYEVRARNFCVAVWTGTAMRGPRWKFDNLYLDDEYLREREGEPFNPIGTTTVIRRLGDDDVPLIPEEQFKSTSLLVALNAAAWGMNEYRNLKSAVSSAGLEVSYGEFNWPTIKEVTK